MLHTTKWTAKFLIGKVEDKNIYLSAPSWDCDSYWSFGYLGNNDCHYHLDGLIEKHGANLRDALISEFKNTLRITEEKDLWQFCELIMTAYALKKTAEILGRGGSNYGFNPCKKIIENKTEATRINTIVLPAIFDKVAELLNKYSK